MARVLLYTRSECVHSRDLRARLENDQDVIEEVNLTEEPQAMTEFLKLTEGRRIVPVVVQGARISIAPDGGTEF